MLFSKRFFVCIHFARTFVDSAFESAVFKSAPLCSSELDVLLIGITMNRSARVALLCSMCVLLLLQGCSVVRDITNALADLKNLEFKLANVSGFRIAGVDISSKRSLSDLSMAEGLALTRAFASKQIPAEFILNVDARNPNDGSNGKPTASATLVGLDWKLYLDSKETISGDIAAPVSIPAGGQTTTIPLRMQIDLYRFFGDRGYDGLINLAMALGGVQGSTSKVVLDAQPKVNFRNFGEITYPGRLKIVDTEFRGGK